MTIYSEIASYGGVYFKIINISVSYKPSTLKTNIGKTFVEKEIFLRNKNDTILNITGIIEGLSQSSLQTKSDAIENDRNSLIALDDGYKHTYNDGKHSGDFVIIKNTLNFNDEGTRSFGEPNIFTFNLISW